MCGRPLIINTDRDTLCRQARGRTADAKRCHRDTAVVEILRQVSIGPHDARRQQKPRLCRVDPRRFGFAACSAEGGAIPAPQVEVETGGGGDAASFENTVGDESRRDAEILTLLGGADAAVGREARAKCRTRLLRQRIRRRDARRGSGDVGRRCQSLVNQRVELRVAKARSPAIAGPGRQRCRKRGVAGERLRCADDRGTADARDWRTRSGGEHQGEEEADAHCFVKPCRTVL